MREPTKTLLLVGHVLALGACALALWAFTMQRTKSRDFAKEMEGLQKAGRLVAVSRQPDSDAMIPDPKGGEARRRVTWHDRFEQVTYVATVDPKSNALLDLSQLYVEYRYGWATVWKACWIAIVIVSLSLVFQLARRLWIS